MLRPPRTAAAAEDAVVGGVSWYIRWLVLQQIQQISGRTGAH